MPETTPETLVDATEAAETAIFDMSLAGEDPPTVATISSAMLRVVYGADVALVRALVRTMFDEAPTVQVAADRLAQLRRLRIIAEMVDATAVEANAARTLRG